jgi:hypothetical protein
MNLPSLIAAIDAEISRLQKARHLLAGTNSTPKKKRWVMSAEGRANIVAAQRKRWAARRKKAA